MKRIIIIVWKWKKENIGEWAVCDQAESHVYCLNETITFSNLRKQIEDIVKRHTEDLKIILFLHKNKFEKLDIGRLLNTLSKETKYIKCCFFGEGRGYIYHSQGNIDGILGVSGVFVKNSIHNPKKSIRSIDKQKFNKLWLFYFNEIKLGTYALSIDLSRHFLLIMHQKEGTQNSNILYLHLKKDALLKARLASFCGKELKWDDKRLLMKNEKENHISYSFNNIALDIKYVFGETAYGEYISLITLLEFILNPPNGKAIIAEKIMEIRRQFNNLLNSMPESTFY